MWTSIKYYAIFKGVLKKLMIEVYKGLDLKGMDEKFKIYKNK